MVDIEVIQPRETSGSSTQGRFLYQRHFICYKLIELLGSNDIEKVYCDFHSDCVIKYTKEKYDFYQVKGVKGKLFNNTFFKESVKDLFHCYLMVDGFCNCIIATNGQKNPDLIKLEKIQEHYRYNKLNEEDTVVLKKLINKYSKILEEDFNIEKFQKFLLEIEIMDEMPSFFEVRNKNYDLKSTNIDKLKVQLDSTLGNSFHLDDCKIIYQGLLDLVESKSILTARTNRFITKEELLDYINIPSFQKSLFRTDYTQEEVDSLDKQSILEGKLRKGGFKPQFIAHAKLVRYVTKIAFEKISKFKGQRELINEFNYKLTSICLDAFEKQARKGNIDQFELLNDLERNLLKLTSSKKYAQLPLDSDVIRGLIWEATSQCKFRWHDE